MAWEAWLTLSVVGVVLCLLSLTRIGPDIILMGALTALLVTGVLTPEQALSGLSNPAMVTVGVLYFVVTGLSETGALGYVVRHVLGRVNSVAGAQARLMAPVLLLSAFLSNTAVVAVMIQAVNDWARHNRISVSKLFMPLSFAGIFGGTCTLIGTTTNLVVNGMLIADAKLPSLGMFTPAWVGVPCAIVGFVMVLLLSPWLLPERKPALTDFEDLREYTIEMLLDPNSPLVGQTLEQAGLRNLPGMYLAEIERGKHIYDTVDADMRLEANDRLLFVGIVDTVVDLLKVKGLNPATEQIFKLDSPRPERALVEAVVSDRCPLVGKSIKIGRFRSVYDAVVIGVARGSDRIKQTIGDVVLQPGDTLLLETPPSFLEKQRNSRDFYCTIPLEESSTPRHERAPVAAAILIAMVVSASLGWLSVLKAAMLAAGLMVVTRCVSGTVARRSIDWQVLLVIGASFGIGHAMQVSGAAQAVAGGLISLSGSSPWLTLAIVYLVTSLFTAAITNNAAAVLVFPIAMASAQSLNVSVMPFAMAIMMAASASFATPIGYQTNLMVFGPGGYHFGDFLRLGLPLNVALGIVAVLIIPLVWWF